MRSLASVIVDDATGALIGNGRVLPAWDGDGPWAVFDDSERLLAVYERYDGPTGPTDKSAAPAGPTAKPAVVLPTIPP